jgi:hypothetical protein
MAAGGAGIELPARVLIGMMQIILLAVSVNAIPLQTSFFCRCVGRAHMPTLRAMAAACAPP